MIMVGDQVTGSGAPHMLNSNAWFVSITATADDPETLALSANV
jgi:hypothetical protein